MDMPRNSFKRALAEKRLQIGFWLGLADPYSAEIAAGAGFDWLLIDGEHAPNDLRTVLAQLQAIAPYPSHPVVRPVDHDVARIKQLLDIGAQTLLVPLVETPEQAKGLVAAMRYPPKGIRGVGTTLARAARWNRIRSYAREADGEMCLLVQVETRKGIDNLDAIAAVEGVDGVFIGASDLAASMGHLGDSGHPEVKRTVEQAFARIKAAGKAPGALTQDAALARTHIAQGVLFCAVGTDTVILSRTTSEIAQSFADLRAGGGKS